MKSKSSSSKGTRIQISYMSKVIPKNISFLGNYAALSSHQTSLFFLENASSIYSTGKSGKKNSLLLCESKAQHKLGKKETDVSNSH